MSFLEWNNQYNVGVEGIDQDHRKFLELINTLHDAVRQGKGQDLQGKILSNLITHVHSHFAAEEDFMRRCRYPSYEDHKSEHRVFAGRVYGLQRELALGNQSTATEMFNTIANWFQHHITGTDVKLRPYALRDLMIK